MITTLTNAKNEIQSLRRQNELLNAQMDVVHIFAAALGRLNNRMVGGAMHPDIVDELNQLIAQVEKKDASAGDLFDEPTKRTFDCSETVVFHRELPFGDTTTDATESENNENDNPTT